MTSYTEKQNNATKVKQTFVYDEYGNISQEKITGQASQTYKYSYDNLSDRRFNGMSFDGIKVDIKYYENLDRIKTKKVTYNGTEIYTKTYYYRKVKHDSLNYATNQPESIIYTQGEATKQNIQYTYYDATGLLSDISYNGDSIHYSYDGGKLSRENNQLLGMSRIKYYHDSGNISKDIKGDYKSGTAAISNSSSTSYSYNGDRMMSFGNQACEYDSMGNPTKYRGKMAEWKGRQLTQLGTTKFTYDGRGRRISKDNTTFFYDSNGRLIKQYNNTPNNINSPYTLIFYYDFEGVAAFKYIDKNNNGTMYFYLRDAQGNIIAILDSEGNPMIKYYYDAWGNHMIVNANISDSEITNLSPIGDINPFRYRGYYYDVETGLYFLQTRYYDPEVGRFLNRDSVQYADPETINGLNLYAYCLNNPVEYADPTGQFWDTVLDILFIGWDIYNLIADGGWKEWENWATLGADLAFAVVPFVSGGGQVVKLSNVGDKITDFSKITVIGETMSRVQIVSQFVNAADNLYDGFTYYNKLSSLGKGGKILAEIGGKISNITWLFGKLRKGYTIIDIGIDISRVSSKTGRLIRSSSYITERIFLGIWQSRNLWKLTYHIL